MSTAAGRRCCHHDKLSTRHPLSSANQARQACKTVPTQVNTICRDSEYLPVMGTAASVCILPYIQLDEFPIVSPAIADGAVDVQANRVQGLNDLPEGSVNPSMVWFAAENEHFSSGHYDFFCAQVQQCSKKVPHRTTSAEFHDVMATAVVKTLISSKTCHNPHQKLPHCSGLKS